MADDYISAETVEIKFANGKKRELLWGDLCRNVVITGSEAEVTARGKRGKIPASALGGKSLLEFYFIDVGQGDGVLIKTPDNRHILIDAGFNRSKQPTGKNAADFVDWKFVKDYGKQLIEIDAMIASHNDADHYGGLWDLLDPTHTSREELDAGGVRVENFYHAGVAWRTDATHSRWLGKRKTSGGKSYLVQLMGDRADVLNSLNPGATDKLQGEWGKFLDCVTKTIKKDGSSTPITRLSQLTGILPTFDINDVATGKVAVKILAPVEHVIGGAPAVRYFKSNDSQTTNGNSILLRFDYGRVRILLTGDLNKESQRAIMDKYQGNFQELGCDVAKSCHHGSDDVSYQFLSLMKPAVTVISSGDAEGHDHPRPSIVGASAVTGYIEIDHNSDQLVSPLIYSTEIARSLGLGKPEKMRVFDGTPQAADIKDAELDKTGIECSKVNAGAIQPEKTKIKLNNQSRLVTDLVYGLVNVRTDGDRILCATLNENKYQWEVKKLRSRFI
jgi:beta-lactamase superfamily II metal-dependent hydrolase